VLVDEIAKLLLRPRIAPARDAAVSAEPTFSGEEAMQAQHALRSAMGLGPVALPMQALIDMLAAEIAQLRKIGRSDDDIAAMISTATGRQLPASAIARSKAS
jgi:hypothetical protein